MATQGVQRSCTPTLQRNSKRRELNEGRSRRRCEIAAADRIASLTRLRDPAWGEADNNCRAKGLYA